MNSNLLEKNRYKVMRRMALWEGRLSRGRLMDVLGLSGIRVSQLLREVREETPEWFEWDSKSKSYFVTPAAFKRAQAELKAGLSDLSLAAYLAEADIHADLTPGAGPVTVAPWGFSKVNPSTFSRIRLAIEQGTRMKLEYRSMRTPEQHPRTVEPHSLVQAGRRWHMRGYCLETGDFRDFVLGRITKLTTMDQKSETTVAEDTKWTSVVKVRIQAHPNLTHEQQDLVRSEYFDGTAARVHSCRGALLPYLVHELRLALDVTKELPPEYQLAVENVDEVRKWLFPA
ncbi:WYL domain-containing protein [Rhodoferax sp.]|uniref:helix-turn-helix transcriptional regulator n=1 Tax=Rhodoferax sp. TaxID=50421 RepID=UPI002606E112|nr:WYL domain-containing protein [Rhodoferax sp.]MDD2919694.1 WYL domain-containing protein [Rhodoferax sp.]